MRVARSGASQFFTGPGRIVTRNCAACGSGGWPRRLPREPIGMGVCGQADTRVAEIVGSRRSDANACSGSSRVIRLRSWRGGGGDGGGGVCPRSLSELQYSKQGAAVSQPAGRQARRTLDSLSSSSGMPPVLDSAHAVHSPFTYARLASRQAPSPVVGAPPHPNALHARAMEG